MIPTAIPQVGEQEKQYLVDCIDSTFVSTVGPFVVDFEKKLQQLTGVQYAVAVNTGTAAIHASLSALGVKSGDLVIVPSLTFIASANAITYTGARPWFFDVDEESWTLNCDQLEKALEDKTEIRFGELVHKESGQRVSCIMPVFTLGNPPNLKRIRDIANKYQLPVMADAAAGLGACFDTGTLAESVDLMSLSFNGNKTFTCGGGGAILGNNEDLLTKVRHLTTTARIGANYDHDMIGFNYRLPNVCAAIGLAQLERYDEFVNKKQEIQKFYDELAEMNENITPFPKVPWGKSSYWLSGVYLSQFSEEEVNEVVSGLKQEGILSRLFWKPMHLQGPFKEEIKESMPVSEKVWYRIFVLPCSTGITSEELTKVAAAFQKVITI